MIDFKRPLVMGILNVTPDSFSDGGCYSTLQAAIERGHQLLEEGADYLDIGGESTRPGALPVSVAEEVERVLPVLEGVLRRCPGAKISIDTSNPLLMKAALEYDVAMINDVRAFSAPNIESVLNLLAQRSDVDLCVMHMLGSPDSMQLDPSYDCVVEDVCAFLNRRVNWLELAGISRSRIIVDPGIGFGKNTADNLALMTHLRQIRVSGCRQLVGISRKSVIGQVLQQADPTKRIAGSLGALAPMAMQSVDLVRVHDVRATVDCLSMMEACWPKVLG